MTISEQRTAFMADILANPADDTPRLVFADWLEEFGGEPERAEFIRCQIELAGLGKVRLPCGTPVVRTGCAEDDARENALRRQSRGLLLFHGTKWVPNGWEVICSPRWKWRKNIGAEFHRGFVERVVLAAHVFNVIAGDLFRQFPIAEVRLADRHPVIEQFMFDSDPHYSCCYWAKLGSELRRQEVLPPAIFDELDQQACVDGAFRETLVGALAIYGWVDEAYRELFAACLRLGRQRAKE